MHFEPANLARRDVNHNGWEPKNIFIWEPQRAAIGTALGGLGASRRLGGSGLLSRAAELVSGGVVFEDNHREDLQGGDAPVAAEEAAPEPRGR